MNLLYCILLEDKKEEEMTVWRYCQHIYEITGLTQQLPEAIMCIIANHFYTNEQILFIKKNYKGLAYAMISLDYVLSQYEEDEDDDLLMKNTHSLCFKYID